MWLTVEEAVRVTGRSERTIRRWLADGILPRHDVLDGPKKRRVQIDSRDLEELGLSVNTALLEEDAQSLRVRVLQLEQQLAQGVPARLPAPSTVAATTTVPPPSANLIDTASKMESFLPNQVGDLTLNYFEGVLSKATCVKIAIRHGMSANMADKFCRDWPPEERRSYDEAIRYLHGHMTRPSAVKAFQLCSISICLCHDLT